MPKLVSVHVMRSDMKAERDIAAATRRGRGVTAAWNWRFVLVDELGFVLIKVLFWSCRCG